MAPLAALAGVIYVLIAVLSVFFGRKIDLTQLEPGMSGIPQGIAKLPPQVQDGVSAEEVHEKGTPGTVILVGVFLTVFVLYYFTNWKLLSMVWKIG